MATINLLSWNVQKFGPDKAQNNDFIEYVCRVIDGCMADLVGFMEVVGDAGESVVNRCLAGLNNLEAQAAAASQPPRAPIWWAGWASPKTLSNEQYVFLWKTDRINAIDARVQGMTRLEAITQIQTAHAGGAPMQQGPVGQDADVSLWASLEAHGYIDNYGNVPWARVNALIAQPGNLNLTIHDPQFDLSDAEKGTLLDALLGDIPQEFSEKRRRPPAILRAIVGNTATPVIITLFHAPGPGSVAPVFSSNQIGALAEIRDAPVGVVMGDFNLKANQLADATRKLRHFNRAASRSEYTKTAANQFITTRSFQRLTGPAYATQAAVLENTAVGQYFMLLDGVNTSVAGSGAVANGAIDNAAVETTLSSPYDKFFVRSPGATQAAPGANAAMRLSLIDIVIPQTATITLANGKVSTTTVRTSITPYNATLANLAVNVYNEWLGRHSKKQRQVGYLARPPRSLADAHYIYAKSISDHLPIHLNFQYA